MELLVLWILSGVVGAAILSKYGKAGQGFAWGCFLGPIGWIVALLIARDHSRPPTFREERECPYRAELILKKANLCKHCGRDVEPVIEPPTLPGERKGNVEQGEDRRSREVCKECGEEVTREMGKCPQCGRDLAKARESRKRIVAAALGLIFLILVIGALMDGPDQNLHRSNTSDRQSFTRSDLSRDQRERIATILNFNGLLCADVLNFQMAKNTARVTCITHRGGSSSATYRVNLESGQAEQIGQRQAQRPRNSRPSAPRVSGPALPMPEMWEGDEESFMESIVADETTRRGSEVGTSPERPSDEVGRAPGADSEIRIEGVERAREHRERLQREERARRLAEAAPVPAEGMKQWHSLYIEAFTPVKELGLKVGHLYNEGKSQELLDACRRLSLAVSRAKVKLETGRSPDRDVATALERTLAAYTSAASSCQHGRMGEFVTHAQESSRAFNQLSTALARHGLAS